MTSPSAAGAPIQFEVRKFKPGSLNTGCCPYKPEPAEPRNREDLGSERNQTVYSIEPDQIEPRAPHFIAGVASSRFLKKAGRWRSEFDESPNPGYSAVGKSIQFKLFDR